MHSWGGVGHVGVEVGHAGMGWSCRGGVGWVMQGWGGSCRGEMVWVMQGWGGSCSCGMGLEGVGWVMKGWGGVGWGGVGNVEVG